MSEDPKNFREVAIHLRHIRSCVEELRDDIEEFATIKKQIIFLMFSVVVGPAIVAAAKYIFVSS